MTKFVKVTSLKSGTEFILNFHWVSSIRKSDGRGSLITIKQMYNVDGAVVFDFNAMEDFEYFEKHLCEIN